LQLKKAEHKQQRFENARREAEKSIKALDSKYSWLAAEKVIPSLGYQQHISCFY
jgi:exonuclease VII small subunit